MMRRFPCVLIGIFCAAMFLLPGHSHAQKLMIPHMMPGGGDILQVEGIDGVPAKINFSFNFRKEKITGGNQVSYPMMHDEVLYLTGGKLTINKGTYLVSTGSGVQSRKIAQKTFDIDSGNIAEGTPLKNAIHAFLQQVINVSGIAGKKGHSIAVLQVNDKALTDSITQIENTPR
jgi:hypothetical protein